jgi:hypothetical protein
MEPDGSLPHSQVPATCPYCEPAQSSPYPHIPLPEDHLNIILPSNSGSLQWSLSLRFPHQNPVHACPPYALHAPPISSRFYHPQSVCIYVCICICIYTYVYRLQENTRPPKTNEANEHQNKWESINKIPQFKKKQIKIYNKQKYIYINEKNTTIM